MSVFSARNHAPTCRDPLAVSPAFVCAGQEGSVGGDVADPPLGGAGADGEGCDPTPPAPPAHQRWGGSLARPTDSWGVFEWGPVAMDTEARDKAVYLAKLAEQAERYDGTLRG